MIFNNDERNHSKLFMLAIVTVITFAVKFLFLSKGLHIIYQNLLFIPIVLSCYWYGKRAMLFVVILNAIHFVFAYSLYPEHLTEEIIRIILLILIAIFILKMSEKFAVQRIKIRELDKKLENEITLFKKAEQISHMGNYKYDVKTGSMEWSDELYRIFGIEVNSVEPTIENRFKFSHPDDREYVEDVLKKAIKEKGSLQVESRILRPDGSQSWVLSSGYVELDELGEVSCFVGTLLDITERKVLEKKLYEEKEKLKITIASIGDGVIATNKNGKVTFINDAAQRFTGWEFDEAVDKSICEILNLNNGTTRINCEEQINSLLNHGFDSGSDSYTLISKDGTKRIIGESIAPIKDYDGFIQGSILILRDITEITNKQNEVYNMSYKDSLTGLYNRRFFEEEMNRINTQRNLPISIIMGDLNGLKLANDVFGHKAGDELLIKAAESIKAACRKDEIAARWGGDEFTILLPNTTMEETKTIISRIQKFCEDSLSADGIIVSVSFGFATKENDDYDLYDLLKNAEENMYHIKSLERNRMVENIIKSILFSLYKKNPGQELHSFNVSEMSIKIGKAINLPEIELYKLKQSSLLHDIGNIAMDEKILSLLGVYTEQELKELWKHTEIGYRILGSSSETVELAQYVLHHHERYDGLGFPMGLKKDEIPLLSRIISVADFYDVSTNEKAFKNVRSKEAAAEELVKNKGTQLDPYIVDVFIEKVLSLCER